ncbi:2-oxo-4-hydroxy-4-carboxy-5-ureidoimidazoline decarboxylase [Myxococcaceae bacterium GXIMD 01537]
MTAREQRALHHLNGLAFEDARAELLRCCGATRWADAMARARPFRDAEHLLAEAEWLWSQTKPDDWREAFRQLPRLGEVENPAGRDALSFAEREQRGVHGASEQVRQGLAEGNRQYEQRFGFTFVTCATGKSGEELLTQLRERLDNPAEEELRIAASEQLRITRMRLEMLLAP